MLSLPVELHEQIFDYLSRQDVLSLAQTCKSLGVVASARLRTIIPELDVSAFTRCIRVLAADPARAAEVLELNIAKCELKGEAVALVLQPPLRRYSLIATLRATILKTRSPPTIPIEINTLPCDPTCGSPRGPLDFSHAFTNLTRLRKLVIHAPQNPLLWMSPVVVVTLREIYVHSGAESTPLLSWISYQPHIHTLRVHCNGNRLRQYRVSPPNSMFFPSLSHLTINLEATSILLPECMVKDLNIEGLKDDAWLTWALHESGTRPEGLSPIKAMSDHCKRTPLRCLTMTGETIGIFKCLRALGGEGVFLSHVRVVLSDQSTESTRILVCVNGC